MVVPISVRTTLNLPAMQDALVATCACVSDFGQFSMFGNGRNDRHEVGFPGAVVAPTRSPLLSQAVELQLRENGCQSLGHFV